MVKYTGSGLMVKRPGVLSKVQMLNLVLGVGVFSLLPKNVRNAHVKIQAVPFGKRPTSAHQPDSPVIMTFVLFENRNPRIL